MERLGMHSETTWRVLAGLVGGTAVGGILGLLLSLGFDYLGDVEAGPLGTLVGVLVGGVFGGAVARGVRGTITGVIIGAGVGVMLGEAVSNGGSGLPGLPSLRGLSSTESISVLKSFVLGMITGGTVGTIMGAVPRERGA